MIDQKRMTLIAAIVASLWSAPALALGDGPAIASDWTDMDVSQSECFARGEAAIKRMGFGEIEQTKFSRFATKDDYTIAVRCIREKRVVLFMASGRDRQKAQSIQLELHRQYFEGR